MPSKFDHTGYPGFTPWQTSEAIKKAIETELSRLAVEAGNASGVTLQYCANGEVMVKATDKEFAHAAHCGHYGDKVAEILNECKPRCGEIHYGRNAIMAHHSGWCWVLGGHLIQALKKREA